MTNFDYDIAIVGCGPAGSSAALHLAKYAPSLVSRTVVLERSRHPRLKLCAGALVPDVFHILEPLGHDVGDLHMEKVSWLHTLFEGNGGKIRFFPDYAFPVVDRVEFDAWLASKVLAQGFTVEEDTPVKLVQKVHGGVEVTTNRGIIRARAVIGADGSTGVVRKAVHAPTGTGVGRSIEVFVPPTSSGIPSPTIPTDAAFIEFGQYGRGIPGFVWCFPGRKENAPRRSFGGYDSRFGGGPLKGSVKDLLAPEMTRYGYELEDHPIHGAPVRWFQPNMPMAAPYVVLAGDAAGVDAFFGEGISLALGYGRFAAKAVATAFDSGDFSFASYTKDIMSSAMGRSLWARWYTAKFVNGMRSRALQAAFWNHSAKAISVLCEKLIFNWSKR